MRQKLRVRQVVFSCQLHSGCGRIRLQTSGTAFMRGHFHRMYISIDNVKHCHSHGIFPNVTVYGDTSVCSPSR